tara:strand:- start:2118 stop:2954 length:837 start_codon:yes stop_codon:yes gene_type:complete
MVFSFIFRFWEDIQTVMWDKYNFDNFTLRLARDLSEVEAAQRLRYDVFIDEMGANSDFADHDARLEIDKFDEYCDHLLLFDNNELDKNMGVVGVYRVLPYHKLPTFADYYSHEEYDLKKLKTSGRKIMELGRSCVHRSYRDGTALTYLWAGLSKYVEYNGIEILFGVASFHGTDPSRIASSLSLLHYNYLAPPDLMVNAKSPNNHRMDLVDLHKVDRVEAVKQIPSLIKAYLRIGGFVGKDAYIDWAFNTIDVCMVLDLARANLKRLSAYKIENYLND